MPLASDARRVSVNNDSLGPLSSNPPHRLGATIKRCPFPTSSTRSSVTAARQGTSADTANQRLFSSASRATPDYAATSGGPDTARSGSAVKRGSAAVPAAAPSTGSVASARRQTAAALFTRTNTTGSFPVTRGAFLHSRIHSAVNLTSNSSAPRFTQPTASSRAHRSNSAATTAATEEVPTSSPALVRQVSSRVFATAQPGAQEGTASLIPRGGFRLAGLGAAPSVPSAERATPLPTFVWPPESDQLISPSAAPLKDPASRLAQEPQHPQSVAEPAPHINGSRRYVRKGRGSSVTSATEAVSTANGTASTPRATEVLRSNSCLRSPSLVLSPTNADDTRSASVASRASSAAQPVPRCSGNVGGPTPQRTTTTSASPTPHHTDTAADARSGSPSAPTPLQPSGSTSVRRTESPVVAADAAAPSVAVSAEWPPRGTPPINGAVSHAASSTGTTPRLADFSRTTPSPVTAARYPCESFASTLGMEGSATLGGRAMAVHGVGAGGTPRQRPSLPFETSPPLSLAMPSLDCRGAAPLSPDASTVRSRVKALDHPDAVLDAGDRPWRSPIAARSLSVTSGARGTNGGSVGRRTPPVPALTWLQERRVTNASSAASTSTAEKSLSLNRGVTRSPRREDLAAFREDLQVLRQREEEGASRPRGSRSSLGRLSVSRRSVDLSGEAAAVQMADESEQSEFLSYLADEEEAEEAMDSEPDGSLRATDTTGHAPITPRLRRRIEQEQQRELELLRTITQERHPENVDLLDSPESLMRELERMDAEHDDHGSVDATSIPRETSEARRDDGDAMGDEEEPTAPSVTRSVDRRTQSQGTSLASSPSTSTSRGSRVRANGKAPIHDVKRDSGAATAISKAAPRSAMPRRGTAGAASSGRRGNATPTPRTQLAAKGRETNAAASPVQRGPRRTGGVAGGARGTSGDGESGATRLMRQSSKGAPGGSGAAAVAGPNGATGVHAHTHSHGTPSGLPQWCRETRRRPNSSRSSSGGPTSSSGGGARPLSAGAAAASQPEDLLPALYSPQEAENTITIVFDLDETLCNNRCLAGTLLRPGAELLLRTLRGLCPSPRYKFMNTNARSQRVTNRLYDEAMTRMGMTPLYRPRVAQRQAENGYLGHSAAAMAHAADLGTSEVRLPAVLSAAAHSGSTGEARPAKATEPNPLRLELVLWTASEEGLARRAMRALDPANKIFDEAIYRDARWYRDSYYTKELCRLGRSMDRVIIVENSIESVIRNRGNAILVASFVNSRMDRQLFLVREVLRDWVRGMKANLASRCATRAVRDSLNSAAACESPSREVSLDQTRSSNGKSSSTTADTPQPLPLHSVQPHAVDNAMASLLDASITSTGVLDLSSSASDARMTTSARGSAGGDSSPLLKESPLRPAPRPLSAMARRAPFVTEFLHNHRLILPDSNFLRFQLTKDVMAYLQATEPAAIAAALPPAPPSASEQADARPTRLLREGRATPGTPGPTPPTATVPSTPSATATAPSTPATKTGSTAANGTAPTTPHLAKTAGAGFGSSLITSTPTTAPVLRTPRGIASRGPVSVDINSLSSGTGPRSATKAEPPADGRTGAAAAVGTVTRAPVAVRAGRERPANPAALSPNVVGGLEVERVASRPQSASTPSMSRRPVLDWS